MSLISNFFNLVITYPIFNVLMLLYHLFGDFGLSIIMLTIAITTALLPLTLRQLKSMKARLALQPQVAEIRRRYAQDLKAQGRLIANATLACTDREYDRSVQKLHVALPSN